MKYIARELEKQVIKAVKAFPSLVLTGPRRSGKTRLLRQLFPKYDYYLLEDPDVISRLRADPRGFLDEVKPPVILDEVQHVPEVFSYVRTRIDRNPGRKGQWLLTGSQEAPLMRGVSESMAGRAAVLQLLPLSFRESSKVSLLKGGYPEVLARPRDAPLWFSSFLQTYIERDVRAVTAVKDLATYRRFLSMVASRHGQMLNKTDLAAPLGVSVPTITEWLGILETTAQILIVPPYFENFGKRLVKAPKVYLSDSGLACHLLGVDSLAELAKSPFLGVLFEGWIASEIVKSQLNRGRRRDLYYFRDQQGLEVDFMIPGQGGSLTLVECKSGRTIMPAMATALERLSKSIRQNRPRGRAVTSYIVHQPSRDESSVRTVAPGVRAYPWDQFLNQVLV